MKHIVLFAFFFMTTFTFGQKIKLKVTGQKDTTVFLIKYYGKNLLYADTAEMKNGLVEFKGSKQKPGILGLLLPGQKYFEFIYNNEEVHLETAMPDLMGNLKVKKSLENEIFTDYIMYMTKQKTLANSYTTNRDKHKKDSKEYEDWTRKIDSVSKLVVSNQKDIVKNHSDKLVGKIVQMSMDVEIPPSPKNPDGTVVDSLFAYKYYKKHFFDNIDLNDDRLVNSPIFHQKLEYYFSKSMLIQHPDTIVQYAYEFCDRLKQGSEMFKYSVVYVTSTFEKSKIIGMDKVFVRMGEKYYCSKNADGKSPAFWMPEDKLKELCDKVNTNKNLVFGVRPPNISLRDTTDVNWKDFYSIDAEYTILYFWDPECGHCKKVTPKLQELYAKKLKARNVEVFAVSKAIGDEFDKWKKFIKKNEITFINVALTDKLYNEAKDNALKFVPKYTTLEALNFQETYDIFSTPRVFVLDKDKKIVSKSLTISQLEDFLDRMQNIKDPVKIIPEDKEEEKH
jgi:thiol-disulfide isomerase/thioredoxin